MAKKVQEKRETNIKEDIKPSQEYEKTKLLIVSDTFLPKRDGVMKFISELVPRFSDDYNITLLVPDYGIDLSDFFGAKLLKIPVSRFGITGYKAAKLKYGEVKNAVNESDIVFVQSGLPLGILAVNAAKKLKKPVVTYVHQLGWEQVANILVKRRWPQRIVRFFMRALIRKTFNKCSRLIIPSASISEQMKKEGFTPKMEIIPLAVGDEFSPTKDIVHAKKKLGINPKYTVIGYTGRISTEKSLVTLHDAFLRLRRENKNIYLLLVGGGKKELVERLKGQNIIITGFVENVVPYLHAMDIFVMPSLTETSSLSTLEAMQCGIPVIATPVGHIKEYVESGYNGFLFPRQNPSILMEKIKTLIDNPSLRKKLGNNAHKLVKQKYNWDKTAVKIECVLEKILSEK